MSKALILGGTAAHKELIRQLKKRGYHTILIDYFDNPPAKEDADEHVKISTLDKEAVLEYAKKTGVDLVISTSVDQANAVCCYVSEKLGLPFPYSYETALDMTDKTRMKQIMKENRIPTAEYIIADKEYFTDENDSHNK